MTPVVGLSTYRDEARWGPWDREAAILSVSYIDCVAQAGGRPVLVPPADGPGAGGDSAKRVAERLDALVLVGGADVDPERYGAVRDMATGPANAWRDDNELAVLGAFLEAGKPVLGVCRGLQVINTFFGGTLHQHLPDVIGSKAHQPAPGQFEENKVRAVPGSVVEQIMGDEFSVLCCHHQSIDVVGRGLTVTAQAGDGVIEAVESDDAGGPFLVAVQWHPEQSMDLKPFRALVEAC